MPSSCIPVVRGEAGGSGERRSRAGIGNGAHPKTTSLQNVYEANCSTVSVPLHCLRSLSARDATYNRTGTLEQ